MIDAFPLEEHAGLLVRAGRALRGRDLAAAHSCPSRYDPLVLPYEPVNAWHAWRGRNPHLFDRTALPGLYRRMLSRRDPALGDVVRLLVNQEQGPADAWERVFGASLTDALAAAGVLAASGTGYVSRLRFVPCFDRLYVADSPSERAPLMVWLGKDTMHLLGAVRAMVGHRRFTRALDVGCGTGLLGIELSRRCEEVTGLDINPRALACGRINARINDAPNVEFLLSDLFERAEGRYDLVVANPPYVYEPPDTRGNLHSFGGEDFGVDLQLELLAGLDSTLTEDGVAVLLCCSPVVKGTAVLPDRIRRRFGRLRLAFDFAPLFNNTPPELIDYHEACGIQYTWAYIVTVRRAPSFELQLRAPSPWIAFSSWAYRSLVRARHRAAARSAQAPVPARR